jgi:hypothetical protein
MRSVPIGNIIDIALICSGCDEISIPDGHIDHSVFEIKILLELYIL